MNRKVLLTAALSRLIDLHDTRHTPGQDAKTVIQTKAAYENAAYHLSLGLSILEALHELEKEGGLDTFQSKSRIADMVADIDREYDLRDIDFCLKMFSTPREIRFISDDTGRESSTSDTTKLIERSVGEIDQYRLTKSAQLFFRVSDLKENWIYEGENAKKIVRAMEYGFFDDIPQLCQERITDLLGFCKMITRAKERAAFDEAVEDFFQAYSAHKQSLEDARSAIKESMSIVMSGESFDSKFEEWQTKTGRHDMTSGHLLTYLERVVQVNMTASRQLMEFVDNILKYKAACPGLIDFKAWAFSIAQGKLSSDLMSLSLQKVMPAIPKESYFHPLDWVESIELDKTDNQSSNFTVDMTEERGSDIEERFNDYLIRNKDWIVDLISTGPISFSKMLERGDFALEEGESPAMLHGFCASPETFEKLAMSITVRYSGEKFAHKVNHKMIHGDDLEICLEGEI